MIKVNRHQRNLIKRHLGLSKLCHSSSLLQTVGILPLSVDINLQTIDLLKTCVITNSLARSFYFGLLCNCDTSNTIVSKCRNFSNSNRINLIQYIFNVSYDYSFKKVFFKFLLKTCVIINSLARSFYYGLLCSCDTSNTIVSKCRNFSNNNIINLIQYNVSYA